MQESLLRLHRWREELNGEDLGFGYDEYAPQVKHHYPEAYAVFGQAYLHLYRVTGDPAYLGWAKSSAGWLVRNPSPRYRNLSWGLPWRWDRWEAPADLSYLITTALVGKFLVQLFEATGETVYLDGCRSVAKWIVDENGYTESGDGVLFFYANHPPLRFPVLNPSVVASCFLARMAAIIGEPHWRDLSERGFGYAARSQNPDGSWHYSEERRFPDSFHTALVLEALQDYLRLSPGNPSIQRCLERGLSFYRRRLFTRNGRGMEVLPPWHKRANPLFLYRKHVSGKIRSAPARLWSYGAAVRLFAKQGAGSAFHRFCLDLLAHVLEDFQLPNGAFRYRMQDERTFVRHEAHIMDGLATMLEEEQRRARSQDPETDSCATRSCML
ncbi:MAG: hypothetical protein AB1640_20640 [bacterium]